MGEDDAKPPGAPQPPRARSAKAAVRRNAFVLRDEFVDAYHVRGSDVLFVTFDDLGTVEEYDPPQPWMHRRLERMDVSVLGMIAKRKDWYRNPSAARLLTELRDAGFFDRFSRILFTGSSMGGYAALTFAGLVPGAEVMAFSPQSTLNRDIAPFEERFPYGHRKWDWETPDFLDAAEAVPRTSQVWLIYDPFVPEDRAHARRLDGPNVRHVKLGHFGHRAIRKLSKFRLLDPLVSGIAAGSVDWPAFWRDLRQARRDNRAYLKTLLGNAEAAGHGQLTRAAAVRVLEKFPRNTVARAILAKRAEPAKLAERPRETPDWTHDPGPRALSGDAVFTDALLDLDRPLVVPERPGDRKLACGVLEPGGRFVEESRSWILPKKHTVAPTLLPGEDVSDLAGVHIFGGHLRGHFGHFLVESSARLWALERLQGRIDSVIYMPFRGKLRPARKVISSYRWFFDVLGINTPIQTFDHAVRPERLFVPEMGFGWGARYAGSPAYRAFMRSRLEAATEPRGGEKLYISRSRLLPVRGRVLGESAIEAAMAANGYEIFHPQKASIEEQVARYRAARDIVALDGSALHLAAFVMPPGGRVAIILRRSKANVADYLTQYRAFCGITPGVVDALVTEWVAPDIARSDYRSVGELDFAKVFARLAELGMLPEEFRPDLPPREALMQELAAFSEARGASLIPLAEARMRAAE
ncbi:glycosyltransferase family 61 protein [Rhodosalinus sediminis]|uniref:Glycosyltransferase family 61 protein n=1 Tax=Rhodosalinus sediminis TaxID=1940533 RepID=A0A3D9BJ82_9RHOB|nr:glycosyltransferase 61 family protein [Rhodosalinus sediminis]REC53517.1 glycosyltransferase family 61 protein [Rhodosalinus sediminis]